MVGLNRVIGRRLTTVSWMSNAAGNTGDLSAINNAGCQKQRNIGSKYPSSAVQLQRGRGEAKAKVKSSSWTFPDLGGSLHTGFASDSSR